MNDDGPSIPTMRRELPVQMEIDGVEVVVGRCWFEGGKVVEVEIDPVHRHRVNFVGGAMGVSVGLRRSQPAVLTEDLGEPRWIDMRGASPDDPVRWTEAVERMRAALNHPVRRPDTLGFPDLLAAVERMPLLEALDLARRGRDLGTRPPEPRTHPRFRVPGAGRNPVGGVKHNDRREARKRERKARKAARKRGRR